ncbi:MAG: lytic murein transglycosylase, partial [Actinobacteria bacterium]|nr:lytic murein transglycosylase [Actinomycetota bacterium]
MRHTLAALALALALTLAAAAAADTFVAVQSGPAALPSAEESNLAASLLLPPGVFSGPATAPQLLDEAALRELWQRAGAAYGIPWELLASINKIESNFGRNMGPSSAGAVGWMQFMPDTWLRWGMDGSGDGFADPWNAEDAVYSAARYLAAAGGRFDLQRAVFAYNHAQWYVDQVLQLAALYGGGGVEAAFALDRLQVGLEQAQAAVLAARDALARSEEAEAALLAAVAELDSATGGLELLSDQLEAQKNVFQLDWRRAEASAEVARLREELVQAEAALAAARAGSVPAAFAPGAAALLGAPLAVEDYVFPVGGGPAAVSVGRGHHDYAAADIAAPEGSPVYALAPAVVLEAWPDPVERCGIGVKLLAADGLVWSYCHLAYLDPGA